MNEQLGNGGGRLQGPPGGPGGPPGPPGRGGERVIPFGKYLLVDRIAVGGMAEVYTAKSFGVEGFEKILAIKRILPTMAEDEDFIQMFIDEAKIAGQLTHANVVPIYELGKIGDSHYIAMEYVWGKDLLQIMNRFRKMRKQMPASMGAWIGAKMCEGLDYAHRKKDRSGRPLGIIHRDVSPQNCLVSYEGQVKMIDFGIAKAASRNTKTQAGVLKGKFGYMSPEQVRGLPVDHRSDIFAVGTCLYEMLTTERLFVGESDFSTLEKVRNAQVPALSLQVPDIPKELEDIVMKALARDVENRWQSAAEMQEALQRFIARERPPFGTSKLAAWMRTAFAPEMAKEKQRLDSFAKIGPPAPPPVVPQRPMVAVKPPPSDDDEPEELAGEATMMTASPFDMDSAGGGHGHGQDEILEQATQIFFSSDEVQEVDPVRPTMAAAPAGPAPAPRMGGGAVVQAPPRPVGLPPPGGMRPQPMVSVGGPATAPAPQGGPSVQVAGMSGYPPPQPQYGAPPPMGMQPAPMQPMAAPMQGGMQHGMQGGIPAGMHAMPPQQPMMQQPMMQPPPGMQQPGMQQPFGAPPPPATPQRTDTMQLQSPPAAFAQPGVGPAPERKSRRGLIGFFAVAAIGLLGAGLFGGYWMFLRGPGIGTIEVRAVPAEAATAQVSLDGQPRGHAPIRIEGVVAGEHVLVLSQPGFTDVTRPVTVTENGTVALDVALSPAVAAAVVAVAPPPTPVPPVVPVAAVAAVVPGTVDPAAVPPATADPALAGATTTPATPVPAATTTPATPTPAPATTTTPATPTPTPTPAPAATTTPAPTPAPATTTTPARASTGGSTGSSGTASSTRGSSGSSGSTGSTGSSGSSTTRRATPAATSEPATPGPRRPTREPSGSTGSSGSSGSSGSTTPSRGGGGAASAAGQGTLQIQTLPWARVFIDGRDTGRNTPVRELRVPSGSHRIGLRTADGRMTELTVQVPAGETVRIVRQL